MPIPASQSENDNIPTSAPALPPQLASTVGEKLILWFAVLAILAGTLWEIYGRTLAAPFIFDDSASVLGNHSIVRLSPLVGDSEHPGPLNPPNGLPTAGRPLVNLSLALNYYFGRFNPVGYHFFNLIVHILSALLLMAIVQRTLQLNCFHGYFTRASAPLAFTVALFWALHPLQTETVVYITQRTELMVGFFYLATLFGSLRYWEAKSSATRTLWLTIAVAACLAGMASKEVMVSAPLVVLLFDRTFVSGSFRQAIRNSWPLYTGLALTWLLLIFLNIHGPRSGTAGFHLDVPAGAWWFTQCKVLFLYLKLVIWPWPLSILYDIPYFTSPLAAWPWIVLMLLLVVATLFLLWRRSPIGFIAASILLILAPTIIVPIVTEVAAERRMYLPLAAFIPLLVVGAYHLAQRFTRSLDRSPESTSEKQPVLAALVVTAIILAAAMAFTSVRRLSAYNDPVTLWRDTLSTQPHDSRAHNNLANALMNAGQEQEAINQYQEAIRLKDNVYARYNLANLLIDAGSNDDAAAQLRKAIQQRPNFPEALNSLGLALNNTGHYQEAAEALQKSIAQRADNALAYFNLATALEKLQRIPEAIAAAQKAFELAKSQEQLSLADQIETRLHSLHDQKAKSREALPSIESAPASP